MCTPLPSVWLIGAALYTALILFLIRPSSEEWPMPPPTGETVRAKQPVASVASVAAVTEPKVERRNEWVQVAAYTTVVRSRPSLAAPVLLAYSAGRPLRVIAREAGFVHIQDLGSGQLGWVKEGALGPFVGGYREREDSPAAPQIAAVAPPQTTVSPPHEPAPIAAKKAPQTVAVRPERETVASVEGWNRGLSRKRRDRPQRVALRRQETDFAAMFGRAFRGF